jgi:O-acetyl-ADP-ribose deacetylase (regulator of RNase III)
MKYIKGNLLDLAEQGKFNMIIHGANCQNEMNTGVAGQIRERYPKAYLVDQATQKGDINKLGCFTQAYIDGFRWWHPMERFGFSDKDADFTTPGGRKIPYSFTIINAYTQIDYGYDDETYIDYNAIKYVFKQIKLLYDINPQVGLKIGIPKIGAGKGGGDWAIIEKIIDDLGFSDLTCVEYDGE